MLHLQKIITSACIGIFISGCNIATHTAHSPAPRQQAIKDILRGTIISKSQVQVQTDTTTGQILGSVIGLTAGESIGGGDNEKFVGSVAGLLAGMYLGKKIQEDAQKTTATEYLIERPDGSIISVVTTDGSFREQDRVLVIQSNPPVIRLDTTTPKTMPSHNTQSKQYIY